MRKKMKKNAEKCGSLLFPPPDEVFSMDLFPDEAPPPPVTYFLTRQSRP